MDKISAVFGSSVKRLRQQRGLTQSELAASAGISLSFFQNIEAGRRWVGTKTISQLAKSLKVAEAELFSPGTDLPLAPLDPCEVLVHVGRAMGFEIPSALAQKLQCK